MARAPLSSLSVIGAATALAVLATACAAEPAAEVAGVTITTSTTVAAAPVEFDDFVELAWTPGTEYRTNSFLVPVSFVVDREGWISRGAGPQHAALWFDEDLDEEIDATLTVMAYRSADTPDELVTNIVLTEGVRQLGPAVERFIGERATVVVDVAGDPDPQSAGLSECSIPASAQFNSVAGHELFTAGGTFGIPACYRSRIWILQAGGATLTVVGVASDEDEFDRLMTMVEGLLETNITFSG